MQIAEPMTMITDYLLAGVAAFLGWRLLQEGSGRGSRPIRLWGWAFMATALGALTGGTSHGFRPWLGETGWLVLWKVTVAAVGLAAFFLLAGALIATLRGVWQRLLLGLALVKLVVYLGWMAGHNDFRFVIYDYGLAMAMVVALQVWGRIKGRAPGAWWIIGGILLSSVASQIQQRGFSLHTHFNHNDLFHLLQIGTLWLLYRGGLLPDGDLPGDDPAPGAG